MNGRRTGYRHSGSSSDGFDEVETGSVMSRFFFVLLKGKKPPAEPVSREKSSDKSEREKTSEVMLTHGSPAGLRNN